MIDPYDDLNEIASQLSHGIRTGSVEPSLELSESTMSIDLIVEPFLRDSDLSQRLLHAQIVLLPVTLQSNTGPVLAFPERTHQLYQFLQDTFGTGAVEAAIHDEHYVEAALHSDHIIIPDLFLLAKDWLPIVLKALHLFLELHSKRKQDSTVECEIHYQDATGKQLSLKYNGPIDSFERTLKHLYPDQRETDKDIDEVCDDD